MIFRPAPIEQKLLEKDGSVSDAWSFWFKSLEAGKRKDLSTGQVDAATALTNLDNILNLGTVILEPGSTTQYYAFKNQVNGQRVFLYNNGTAVAIIKDVTNTIAVNTGKIIQWDKTLNKWLET